MKNNLKTGFYLFMYGNRNIAGSLLAIVSLALFFAGIISDWWFPIVVGSYGVGYLAFPDSEKLEFEVSNNLTFEALHDLLNDLNNKSGGKLPKEASDILAAIKQTVDTIGQRLFDGTISVDHRAGIINAISRDLPETISNYTKLPVAYASVHVIGEGKTGKQLLLEQLTILNTQLGKIAEGVYQNDAQAILANGRFLKEKFHVTTFD